MNIHLHIANVNVSVHDDKQLSEILERVTLIQKQVKTIQMTNEELLASLTAANTKVDKIITEVQALKDSINTTPNVPQNIVDQANALGSKLDNLDALNDDATTETPDGEQPA